MSFLESVLTRKKEEVSEQSKIISLDVLKEKAKAPRVRGLLRSALLSDGSGLKIIAEFKRRSPSGGSINPEATPATQALAYEKAGASAVSVLTDNKDFGGSLADAIEAAQAVSIPILRKEFIVDPYQIYETAAAGLHSLLLLVSALPGGMLEEFAGLCEELKIDALVEVTNEAELKRAEKYSLLGVNSRDLHSLEVSRDKALDLIGGAPGSSLVVAESGISTLQQAEEVFQAGADAALIGEALMRAKDPSVFIGEMREKIS